MKTTIQTNRPAATPPVPARFQRAISFKDGNGDRCTAQVLIENGRFTMSGEFQNSGGQCFDSVEPATDAQRALLDLWRRWHLNSMRAGTPAQEQALKEATEGAEPEALPDFEQRCALLAAHDLLVVPHPDGGTVPVKSPAVAAMDRGWRETRVGSSSTAYANIETGETSEADTWEDLAKEQGFAEVPRTYSYGSAWLTEELPEDFEDTLNGILEEIEVENEDEPATSSDLPRLTEHHGCPHEAARILALALALGAPLSSALEATIATYDETAVTFEGTDYLVGTDEEMDGKWDEALESYLDECVLPELSDTLAGYFDRESWKRDARHDGRGHALNSYDGGELETELDGETYYAYRR